MYKVLRSFLFLMDPERAHYFSMNALKFFCRIPLIKKSITSRYLYDEPYLQRNLFGLSFRNPVGLGAGFDKNAIYLNELATLGFGFVEIGTVTPLAQEGNPLPRLFRLPKDKALINRMGFNNDGAIAVAKRLRKWKRKGDFTSGDNRLIIGGNIGKNKQTPNDDAWKDYLTCFDELHPYVDYFVVNVSSPNTPGLRDLQQKDSLLKIFKSLKEANRKLAKPIPLLLKIAPDLDEVQQNEIAEVVLEMNLDGIIISNTSVSRTGLMTSKEMLDKIGAGGLSGCPLKDMNSKLIHILHSKLNERIPIIASGGISCGKDALEKMNAGATLVQVWTGFIYEGPSIARNICKSLKENKNGTPLHI